MSYGYSMDIADRVKRADRELLGVQLGLVCIRKGVSVAEVANAVGVTRQTVYHWFCGDHSPLGQTKGTVEAYLKSLG